MSVIVTGGRNFESKTFVWRILDRVWPLITTLVHGDCPSGADHWADEWAKARGVTVERHPADWDAHGKAAGPRRNREMAASGASLCIAFPGGSGTINCRAECRKAGIPVWLYETDVIGLTKRLQCAADDLEVMDRLGEYLAVSSRDLRGPELGDTPKLGGGA